MEITDSISLLKQFGTVGFYLCEWERVQVGTWGASAGEITSRNPQGFSRGSARAADRSVCDRLHVCSQG